MAEKTNSPKPPKSADAREQRLKAALKANLARRKAQARVRREETHEKTGKSED